MTGQAAMRCPTADECLYEQLMGSAAGDPNDHVLACILAAWSTGVGALPEWLGLQPAEHRAMIAYHFPAFVDFARFQGADSLSTHLGARHEEVDDLVQLMLRHRAGVSRSEQWLARLVAMACLGGDHLWQDLGLWTRAELSDLMQRNFPSLAQRNTGDMKWKRFLYRELCEAEGVRVCRSPSCQQCCDYDACFGPET